MLIYKNTVYRLALPLEDEGFVGDFWGSAGAGLLFTTGAKILLLLRSESVEQPHTWGLAGGAVRRDSDTGQQQDARTAAIHEAEEEMGALPPFSIYDQYMFRSGSFTYTTFIAHVDPAVENTWTPELNWENDDYGWFALDELPNNLHFGIEAILEHKNLFTAANQRVEG